MSNFQRSGVPQTINVSADSQGTCIRFRQWSSSLLIQASAPATLYWTQEDFDADRGGLVLSGNQPRIPITLNAAVANVWLRGRGSVSDISVTAIGKDG